MHCRRFPYAPAIPLVAAAVLIAGCGKESSPSPDTQVQAHQLGAELDRTKNKLAAAEKESAAKGDALTLAKEETEMVKKQVAEKAAAVQERDNQIRALQGQLEEMKKKDAFAYAEVSKLAQQGLTTSALGRYQKFVADFPASPLVVDAKRAIAELGVTAPRDAKARAVAIDPVSPVRDLLKKFADNDAKPEELAPLLKNRTPAEVIRLLGTPNRTYRNGTELGYDKITDPATGERQTLVISFDEEQRVSALRVGYTGRPIRP